MTDKAVGRRILIVDDEENMRHMLAMMLNSHGFSVATAEDGAQAVEHLKEGHTDIVLCDIKMPVLDGLGFLQRVHSKKLPLHIIMMSAFVDLDTAIECLKLGAADYVSKPFKVDEVLLKIRMAEERLRLEEEKEKLKAENAALRAEKSIEAKAIPGIIGKSQALQTILTSVRKVADYKSTVLLIGESGTGKELLARALHEQSIRKKGPFVAINCGAIPETLLESELFGYVRGAFTDASRNKKGLIEEADNGTLFLDEIGELPLSLQVKLLRFLQEDEIRKVGDTKDLRVDVRVVAATARDLQDMVKKGTFREDLYYRLNVLQLRIPPLRERKDDIPTLVDHFIAKYAERLHRPNMTINKDALRLLLDYHWPGNVRELENIIERAMVLADNDLITTTNLPDKMQATNTDAPIPLIGDDLSIKKAVLFIERELIRRALEKTGGNRTHAAELLEISHRALLYKMKEYKIS